MSGPAPEILTFGCRLNIYESEAMGRLASAAGVGPGTIVVNTCAVTAEAERQARQAIRRARRGNPGARIVVTGCAAQRAPEAWSAMAEVDQVLGNVEKMEPASWQALARGETEPVRVQDIMAVTQTAAHLLPGFAEHTRGYVQVQNGCDHRCTFCVIPYGRGNSRSVPIGAVAAQIASLVKAGVAEVVLTGVDLTSYGADLPGRPTLGQMLRRVLAQVPTLPRLRLSSIDPAEVDDDLWRLIAEEPRLMPHLHLSVQAGHDMVLKRMKRRHSRDDVLAVTARARRLRPDIVFGADLIAGFPTETEEMFEATLALVEDADLAWLHVFPYSARAGTPAARMPQVPVPVRRERAARLREVGAVRLARYLSGRVGRVETVLMESGTVGRTEGFAAVALDGCAAPGTLLPIRITGHDGRRLSGTSTLSLPLQAAE